MGKELTAYETLLDEIVREIEQHRIKAARGLNATQMQLYFLPGATTVGKQEQEGWGKSVVAQLAADLSRLTKSSRGFSAQNLWYTRQYFMEYKDNETLKNLSFQVPWGQNILILSK